MYAGGVAAAIVVMARLVRLATTYLWRYVHVDYCSCTSIMSRFKGVGSLLVTTFVGVVSGVYIFKPLLEQSTKEIKMNQMMRNGPNAQGPPS